MPNINRRTILAGLPALSGVAAMSVMPAAAKPAIEQVLRPDSPQENPELLRLQADLAQALTDMETAKDEREWIVDEWKHRWPLAPDEITLLNAHSYSVAEKDIAGRPLIRPGEVRPRTVRGIENLEALLENMKAPHRLKSAKSIARRKRNIAAARKRLAIGERYHAEIERIREASGIETAKQRVADARRRVLSVVEQIGEAPAHTMQGAVIKAEAVQTEMVVIYGLGSLKDAPKFLVPALKLAEAIQGIAA